MIRSTFPDYCGEIHANMVNTVLCRTDLRLIPVLAEYDICVYIDGNVQITNPKLIPNLLLQAKSTDLLLLNKHPLRQNAYQEATYSAANVAKYKNTNLQKQISKYKIEGFPRTFPLFWNGFIIYLDPHSSLMDDFYGTYTQEAINYCIDKRFPYHSQGQVSLPYVVWKTSLPFCMVPPFMKRGCGPSMQRNNHKNHKIR